MYKTLDIDSYREKYGLADDYKVDDLLVSGVWDLLAEREHLPYLIKTLEKMGITSPVKRIEGEQLGHAYAFDVHGKHYWFVPVMGAAYMSKYAHLACLLGSKKNILIGVVGGLKKGTKPGDFIIPTYSTGNQNAFMYDREAEDLRFYPDKELSQKLKDKLTSVTVLEGPTVTCEVMLAETAEDVRKWSEQGYLGVEMEAATMFALSKHFKVPSTALLTVADNLIEEITFFHIAYNDTKEIRENARLLRYEAALTELLAIS
ncbi:hypothetical protein EOL96_05735 [Candidatus Saccharibacteria bacterium]|nr:hypothetical protein [Candidatus Saccharibacteria bacterium]